MEDNYCCCTTDLEGWQHRLNDEGHSDDVQSFKERNDNEMQQCRRSPFTEQTDPQRTEQGDDFRHHETEENGPNPRHSF